jgi:hypothetical protein
MRGGRTAGARAGAALGRGEAHRGDAGVGRLDDEDVGSQGVAGMGRLGDEDVPRTVTAAGEARRWGGPARRRMEG